MATELGVLHKDLPISGDLRKKGLFKDIDDFLEAVSTAQEGELIVLANGTYEAKKKKDTTFSNLKGTANKPIIVCAEEVGKVTLKGLVGYRFENCKHLTWYGFKHEHDAADGVTFNGGEDNRFARCEVKLVDFVEKNGKKKFQGKNHWLRINNCKRMKVDHCKFHQKSTAGHFIDVLFDDGKDIGFNDGPVIEYNHFLHQNLGDHPELWPKGKKYGDAGGEAIKVGLAGKCRTYYRVIFRYNYLEECNGDGEIISNKSCGNIYYHNTIVNKKKTDQSGSLTLRHGDSTAVLGNYFEGCGLRVFGADNLIANNHFTRNSVKDSNRWPLIINNGKWEKEDGQVKLGGKRPKSTSRHEQVVNNNIILNTFANGDGTAGIIVRWGKGDGLSPTGNRFSGNIITSEKGTLLEFNKPKDKENNIISDNIGWTKRGQELLGGLTEKMAKLNDNPQLISDSNDGIFQPQSIDSIAAKIFIGKDAPFSGIKVGREGVIEDIYGVSRTEAVHAGCVQLRKEQSRESQKLKKRITSEDVGPRATTDLGKSPEWNPPPRFLPKEND
jgi:hypothetical protein